MMRWWPPLLHLLVLALILPLAWQRLTVLRSDPVVIPAPAEAPVPATLPDLDALLLAAGERVAPDALLGRPLFLPGRQDEGAIAPDSPLDDMPAEVGLPRMVGYVDDGTKPRAILAPAEGGEEEIVREGDDFIDFRVLQVRPDTVVLRRAGEEITINILPQ